ncbi:Hsp70 family protein [Plantactinospora sp. DSM 117369]
MRPELNADVGRFRLGIDFGTSNTVAVLAWPDGRLRPLLFDGAPLLPSAVCLDASDALLVGRDAVNAALSYPDRFEPYPKRRIDDGTLLLGDTEIPVGDAIAAVLHRVAAEAYRVAGRAAAEVVLTCPAAWAARRRGVLRDAALRVGLPEPRLVPEPLAAAFHFTGLLGTRVPIGGHLLVYDFGAGTFDASVVRRTADGFTVVATEGLADTGGVDVDAAVVAHLGAVHGERHPANWQRLRDPRTPAERRHHRQLWDGVRAAKESLSRTASALVHVPLLDQDAPLGREQFEQLARPVVDRSVAAARSALLDAGVGFDQLAGLILVGGASRMPIVATQLHRVFGIAPTVLEQPELVVAEGSLLATRDGGAASHGIGAGTSVGTGSAIAAGTSIVAGNAIGASVGADNSGNGGSGGASGGGAEPGQRDGPRVGAGIPGQPAGPAPTPSEAPTVVMRAVVPAGPTPLTSAPASDVEPPTTRRHPVWLVAAAVVVVITLAVSGLVVGWDRFFREPDGDGQFSADGRNTSSLGVADVAGGPAVSGQPSPTVSTSPGAGASGSPGGSPRTGATTTRPRSTAGNPGGGAAPGGGNAPGAPAPAARKSQDDPELVCQSVGIRMTRKSGSGPGPEIDLDGCIKGRNGWAANGNGGVYLGNIQDYHDSTSFKGRLVVETYKCDGGLVDQTDTGLTERQGSRLSATLNVVDSYSGSFYLKAKITGLEVRLDGDVWTGGSDTVTTPCIDL